MAVRLCYAGTYAMADLERCLAPSELLLMVAADAMRAERTRRAPSVPYRCPKAYILSCSAP